MMTLLMNLPWGKVLPYGVAVVVTILVCWKIYGMGAESVRVQWEAERAQLAFLHATEVLRLEKINRTVEVRYMDRVQPVLVRGKERVRVVKEYITKEDDAKCAIAPSFVELHDAAAEDRLPDASASTEPDAGTPTTQLSDVGQTVVLNYNKFHAMRAQCEALQEWSRSLSE